MATPDRPGLFSFATIPTPQPGPDAYTTGATMLKILGWLRVVGSIFALLFVVAGILILTIGSAFLSQFVQDIPLPAGLGAIALGLIILIAALLGLAFTLGFLYWTSWIYAKWTAFDPRALSHGKVMAIITIVFASLGLLTALASFDLFSIAVDGAQLAVGIIFLQKMSDPGVQQLFGQGAMPAMPE